MKVVKGEDVFEASKGFCMGETRQHYYESQLKDKIILDREELEAISFLKVFVNAHDRDLVNEILGKSEEEKQG